MKAILRMRFAASFFILLLIQCCLITHANAQHNLTGKKQPVTFETLLQQLVNRENITLFNADSFTLHHASSYDRHSVEKDKEGWYANNDWDNYIRKENVNGKDEYVLLDADGPGAVTRFWVAGHPNNKIHLRFYIDGQTTPFWEADHTGALIGQNEAIGKPLSQRSVDQDVLHINEGAQPGHNLYAPVPFNHHLKITYDKAPGGADSGFWYNIDYRLYQKDIIVESFSAEATKKYAQQLSQTNKTLNDFMAQSPLEATAPGEKNNTNTAFELLPGAAKNIQLAGAGSIRRLLLSIKAANLDSAVKNLWINIAFDGNQTVNIPAGFLFGCGGQLVEANNWFSKVDNNRNMAAYWVMPYRQKVVISLVNKGNAAVSGILKTATGNYSWNKRSMYFHADFNRMEHYITKATTGQDFNYLTVKNKAGTYAGDVLQVNKNVGGWWGEGDEKIYIDGSKFPDHFGTGSEDYYGYAWGHPETFNHIFNSQPLGDANLNDKGGTTVNSRMRSLDAIPFKHDFVFDMESWNWFGGEVNFDWSCFWYQLP